MRFGPVATAEAEGAILAHSLKVAGRKWPKGRVLGAADLAALLAEGVARVTVARLDPGDVDEAAAAVRLGAALVPDPAGAGLTVSAPHAGRVNLHAARPGLVEVDVERVHALNRIDPALTFATLPPLARVTPGAMVGTAKVISYAVPGTALDSACATVPGGAIRVLPVIRKTAGLILTQTGEEGEAKLAEKGRAAIAGRLSALGMTLADIRTVPHETVALARALGDLGGEIAMILTAAATSDLRDTAPEAVRAAGGVVDRFGMPVDPGNLLFLGRIGARPVIGLPGCSRSPALNGADWVLDRIACGLPVGDAEIAAMGVGGLLKEIPIRPQPRERRG